MISVEEAKHIISTHITPLEPVNFPLLIAAGHILAEDIHASIDIPGFEQSAMDGYAFSFAEKGSALTIEGEMAAGTPKQLILKKGHAIRVFTGAPIPLGADTVVMQEKTEIENGKLVISDEQLQKGSNVRNIGAEIKAGAGAMERGGLLTPASIGFLAGIGVTELPVYGTPAISIIVTGNELKKPGNELQFGQVYESNSFSLRAALQHARINNVKVFEANDEISLLQTALTNALQVSDVVLLTGGVSVGDYDLVLQASVNCGVTKQFHKVKQRPGKPLYFGTRDNKLVFGLPGNPSSVLTCFYEYVLPALERLSGKKSSIRVKQAILTRDHSKPQGLTIFLRGHYENGKASPMSSQESFRLSSFAQSNCLIRLEEDIVEYHAGEMVEVHLLPV